MAIQTMWNEKFSRDGYLYGKKPNAFLSARSGLLKPGSEILMLGEGEGRTAVYMASLGHKVTALDASDIGLEKCRALAQELDVEVCTLHADLQRWKSEKLYDAVLTSFLHLQEPLRSEAFGAALESLKPGGYFMGEFFALQQLSRTSGGPKMPELLYTLESVTEIFTREDCKVIVLEECEDYLDEGRGHQGDALLVRVIVQKLEESV